MIQDKNKNITVTYNFMNLPTKVNFGNGDSIVWVYTASGAKLRKTVYDNGALIKTIDYVSGFVYENSKLDFFNMEHGRVKRLATGSLQYQYTINDHLGNMRAMFADTNADGQADLLQETHYYAFGSEIGGLSAVYMSPEKKNKFTYNGKEAEEEFGLNWYEYGWRMYDPQLGRWHSVDPMDEFHSPYCYVGNNPVNFIDPDGAFTDEPPTWDPGSQTFLFPNIVIEATRLPLPEPGIEDVSFSFFGNIIATFSSVVDFGLMADRWIDGDYHWTDGLVIATPVLTTGMARTLFRNAGTKVGSFTRNLNNELTNGVYTVSKETMKKHIYAGHGNRSIFYSSIDAEEAVLKAAEYADKYNLWEHNRAVVPILNTNIGRTGSGIHTNIIEVTRTTTGYIHGWPGNK